MSRFAGKIPAAPFGFDKDRLFRGIGWHQQWQIFDGILTPGVNSIAEMCDNLNLPQKLSGRRVLDIGAWNGCLSFECERRGAREVVALEPADPAGTGFHKIRDAIGSRRVRCVRGTVYDLDPQKLGYFDLVLFCGVLYHLRYPLLGIDNIRRVCTGDVYVETVVSDAQLLLRDEGGIKVVPMETISPALLSTPLWQFYQNDELGNDSTNWFGPNITAVIQAFESAGFDTTLIKHWGRATFHGKVKRGPPKFLIGSAEGVHYDTVLGPLFGRTKPGEELNSPGTFHPSFQERIRTTILASKEYFRKSGNSQSAWIGRVCAELLGSSMPSTRFDGTQRRFYEDDASYRQAVVCDILASTEYRTHLVRNHYTTFLGRTPSDIEVMHWVPMLQQGLPVECVSACFLASDEYFNRHGGSSSDWLQHVYEELLGRRPDSNVDGCLDALVENRAKREDIVRGILNSLEYRQRLVERLSRTYLGNPDTRRASSERSFLPRLFRRILPARTANRV